jgi:hypothetical protein
MFTSMSGSLYPICTLCMDCKYDLRCICVECTMLVNFGRMNLERNVSQTLCYMSSNPFACWMFNLRCLYVNQYQ